MANYRFDTRGNIDMTGWIVFRIRLLDNNGKVIDQWTIIESPVQSDAKTTAVISDWQEECGYYG